MKDATSYALVVAFFTAKSAGGRIPSPITLRRLTRPWFISKYSYARHHINPVCKAATGLLRSSKKKHSGNLKLPALTKLAMKIDTDLFKVVGNQIRITLQPGKYAWVPLNTQHRKFSHYSQGKASELLITDRKVIMTYVVGNSPKPLGSRLMATDLNFSSLDSTVANTTPSVSINGAMTASLAHIARIQNDFSRRRERLQRRIRNPQRRIKKLRETRGRQSNRIKDALHKLSTKLVIEHPDTTFVFENLKGIRRARSSSGRRFRTYLHRWPFRMFQSLVDYKSQCSTLYVSPRGTSSECPVCGGRLEHPKWAVSRCNTCGVDYDRNRLASLAILRRGSRLCGHPFAVSADASWQHMRNEYLHTPAKPDGVRVGGTNHVANAPNQDFGESA